MYVITGKGRISKGGRYIPLSDFEKEFTEEQIDALLKSKFLKKLKEKKKDDREPETSNN